MNEDRIFAIPLMGQSLDFKISRLFARSPFYLIFNTRNHNIQFIKNEFIDDKIQSGKTISKFLISQKVNIFCACEIGFNVQKIAEKNKVQLIILAEQSEFTGEELLNIIKNKNNN
ncbi:MAG: NifB/NifX family molybdenum-iron cluster-binding protein [Flavobacteriales bacterium]|nr:NifB/NifX family molybdenum-iron cluster-binding protein [Flavobacteriales bacterium]